MVVIYLHELIQNIPELINLFLPGFVFVCVYSWLKNITLDSSLIAIWSLFVSSLIKTFYAAIHIIIFTKHDFNEYFKVTIYVISAILVPILLVWLLNTKIMQRLLNKINYKTLNESIFDDVVDYEKKTLVCAHLKNSDIFYAGTLILREENGMDSYIALVDYKIVNRRTRNEREPYLKSSVLLNLKDIERIELFYENDSKVWEWLHDD